MNYYIFIFVASVFVSSISQILLKISANREYSSKLEEYINWRVILAYSMFFCSTLITVFAYREIPLSLGPVLEATGYIFVAVLSYIFLKENIGKRKMVGLLFIIIGVVVAGLKA